MMCENCGANAPKGKGGTVTGFGFICCAHCVFNPLGCRCKYGQHEVPETEMIDTVDYRTFLQKEHAMKDKEKSGVTPAQLNAAMRGDLRDAEVCSTPGGIEREEKRGQERFVGSDLLPVDCGDKTAWEKLGFVFGPKCKGQERIFYKVQFPKGWKKVPTDHSMWSNIVDETGQVRASVFFKAAFYDYVASARIKADSKA